jgi:hypothetical protein
MRLTRRRCETTCPTRRRAPAGRRRSPRTALVGSRLVRCGHSVIAFAATLNRLTRPRDALVAEALARRRRTRWRERLRLGRALCAEAVAQRGGTPTPMPNFPGARPSTSPTVSARPSPPRSKRAANRLAHRAHADEQVASSANRSARRRGPIPTPPRRTASPDPIHAAGDQARLLIQQQVRLHCARTPATRKQDSAAAHTHLCSSPSLGCGVGSARWAPAARVGLMASASSEGRRWRRRSLAMGGADDLAAVDALQIDAGEPEAGRARGGAGSRRAARPLALLRGGRPQ